VPGGGDLVRAFKVETGEATAAANLAPALEEVETGGGGYGGSDFVQVVPSPSAAAGGRVPARDETVVVCSCPSRAPRTEAEIGCLGGRRAPPELRGGAMVQGSGEENQEM
jgi:hypothetical protein